MKNTSAVMQDNNISRYSYVSIDKQTGNHEVSEYFPDSTDKLMSEILKARAERLNKLKEQEKNEKGSGSQQVVNIASYQARQISEIMSTSKVRSGLLNNLELQKQTVIKNPVHSTAKQEKEEQKQKSKDADVEKVDSSLQVNKINIVLEESRNTSKMQQYRSSQSSKIQYQQEKSEIQKKKKEEEKLVLENKEDKDQIEVEGDKFQLPKVDNLVNQSFQNQDKQMKIEASRAVSQSESDYIQIGYGRSTNPKSQLKENNQISSNNKNIQNIEFYKNDGEMNVVQSKIEPKQSQIYVQRENKQSKDYYQFGLNPKQNETDRQVVEALNQRLNQINEIQQAEINQAVSKRISSQRNPSSANFQTLITAQPEKKNVQQINFVSEFETEYSDDLRDYNILEHHFQSNITFLQKQTAELINLYEAMIIQEQCKQLRKKVKDIQLQNRKYKIMLRNASYSKRFNFHSPISKNNNRPLDFYKKFTVSQNYAAQYHDIVQKIAQQKKTQAQLQQQYKIVNNFQQLMRNKQISSYPPLPFDLQYDNELGKYKTTKIGFFRQNSQKQLLQSNKKNKKYQFSKSKRTVKLQEEEINYYDLLNYKRDICKDTILEFEVFNLGRIKKLKDQNKLISKQIDFVNQQIEQISKQIQSEIRKISGPSELPASEYFIRSKKSFSRSPPVNSKTRLFGITSPKKSNKNSSQRKIVSKGRISLTKSQEKNNLSSKKSLTKKIQISKPSIIAQLNDDYGISSIRDAYKEAQQIPTFGKNQSQQQLLMEINAEQNRRLRSPLIRKVNYIKLNKEMLTRTQVNIHTSKSKQKLMSEQVSPIKKTKKSFSISVDQSKSSNI